MTIVGPKTGIRLVLGGISEKLRIAGYLALLKKSDIQVPSLAHSSWVGATQRRHSQANGLAEECLPEQFARDKTDVGQLIFALKYDGVELVA